MGFLCYVRLMRDFTTPKPFPFGFCIQASLQIWIEVPFREKSGKTFVCRTLSKMDILLKTFWFDLGYVKQKWLILKDSMAPSMQCWSPCQHKQSEFQCACCAPLLAQHDVSLSKNSIVKPGSRGFFFLVPWGSWTQHSMLAGLNFQSIWKRNIKLMSSVSSWSFLSVKRSWFLLWTQLFH